MAPSALPTRWSETREIGNDHGKRIEINEKLLVPCLTIGSCIRASSSSRESLRRIAFDPNNKSTHASVALTRRRHIYGSNRWSLRRQDFSA